MLKKSEVEIMRGNAKVHKEVFEEIKKINETDTGKEIQESMKKEMEEIAKNIKL